MQRSGLIKLWNKLFAPISDAIQSELIGTLFSTRLPLAIAGVNLVLVCAYLAASSHSAWPDVLCLVGIILTVARLTLDVVYHQRRSSSELTVVFARRWERYYAIGSYTFAATIGAAGASAFILKDPVGQMLATALVFGYAAGVVCRISIRPAICLPALLLASVPTALAAIAPLEGGSLIFGFVMLAFLAGSLETVRFLYNLSIEQISLKHEFAKLAQHDALTGLNNRLGLNQNLARAVAQARSNGELIAVHHIDLDQFKAANDRHGHIVGDALLQAVAARLSSLLRDCDFAVRMGGDEFVIVQPGIGHRQEAALLSRRILRTIDRPFAINELDVHIGASIGVAIGDGSSDPALLMIEADEALYASKNGGRNRVTIAKKETALAIVG
jgi:diguanylate cyclase (GGDEF)-like protein